MIITVVFLLLTAYLTGLLMEKLKMPALLGYLIIGLSFSPYTANALDLGDSFFKNCFLTLSQTNESGPIRSLALFIILYRAGLGLDRVGLKENGSSALKLSFIPCFLETAAIAACTHYFLQWPWIESTILGFVLAAVSPAVIVPLMLKLQEEKVGTNKKIPTLILASSTIDDIIALSGFGICISLLSPFAQIHWQRMLLEVILSVILGLIIGYYLALPLVKAFKISRLHPFFKAVLLLAMAVIFIRIEESRPLNMPFSYLFATLSLGISIRIFDDKLADEMSKQFKSMWKVAEIALFVLIGAMVDIRIAIDAGWVGLAILAIGLLARSFGVIISLKNSRLNWRERVFCVIAYLPKATVQATIGGVVYALFFEGRIELYQGISTGEVILAMAAISILITAPLGAIATRMTSHRLLNKKQN